MLRKIREALEQREEGFTLIELLVVVIIIGILAAIAIPVFLNQRKKAWDAAAKSDVKNMTTAQESYYTENNQYTSTVSDLVTEGYNRTASMLACANAFQVTVARDAFVVAAKHPQSTNTWYYSSQTGQITKTPPANSCTPAA